MSDFGVKLIQFTNMNPLFKGGGVLIVGLLAFLFAWWMKKRWQEPVRSGFLVFVGLSVFITLYGLFILAVRPLWWRLPY
ncbi:hypothetical protein COT42_08245 [Candidatus Saganbacteria bacterium CG08_land_8_20_14_0_20_45_16]|uniref:Uncharacterized protein n=1 Tax=Candidatus Saganbacteria bacterium CG08_land_8_20_14_0_20_45_16 TaxID=2014293 RepID=A0A2H0XTS1_UNCSA|nr:MAG: hypothetical protein COT42_08245 [Candidatus Saganbacteria bacterium CG08_land_8_20_14_0_20_45_16]